MGVSSSDVCLGGSEYIYLLLESLGSEDETGLGSHGGRVSGEESEGIEVCNTGGVSNVNYGGNIG